MPIFISILIIFVIWLRYEISKSSCKSRKISTTFWSKEQKANFTRNSDISLLPYITISSDDLPFVETTDERINELQIYIKELSGKKMLNLIGVTNTDLKLKYGVGNLNKLTEYDQNYTLFVRTLSQLASCLYQHNYIEETKQLLECGIHCHSDISNNYTLLATIYKEQGNISGIYDLIQIARNLDTLLRETIIHSLEKILDSNHSIESFRD